MLVAGKLSVMFHGIGGICCFDMPAGNRTQLDDITDQQIAPGASDSPLGTACVGVFGH